MKRLILGTVAITAFLFFSGCADLTGRTLTGKQTNKAYLRSAPVMCNFDSYVEYKKFVKEHYTNWCAQTMPGNGICAGIGVGKATDEVCRGEYYFKKDRERHQCNERKRIISY